MYQKCPICNGTGIVSSGFFDHAGDMGTWVSDHAAETCRVCQGKGIIVDDIKTWQDSTVQKSVV